LSENFSAETEMNILCLPRTNLIGDRNLLSSLRGRGHGGPGRIENVGKGFRELRVISGNLNELKEPVSVTDVSQPLSLLENLVRKVKILI
jgi:hypothetical protein